MSDDEPRRKHWGDRQRAEVGSKHRVSTNPRGVVTSPVEDDNTPVFQFDDETGDEPVSKRDIHRLVRWVKKYREDSDQYISAELTQLLDRPPKDVATSIEKRVDGLERDMAPLNALRKWLWGSLIVIVITVAGFLYTRGSTEGRAIERMDRMEKFIDELRHDIRELERRSSITPLTPPDAVSQAEQRNHP